MTEINSITDPVFQDKDKARQYLESVRWPHGAFCPHCGEAKEVRKLAGKSHRPGLYQCRSCRKQFTVTVGTVFERSHLPLNKWLLATYLICSSKKGISSHQLHRMLNVTYKTAWFMTHRIREALRDTSGSLLGGGGSTVEVDETFWGNKKKKGQKGRGYAHKEKILTLVERDGRARSFHVPAVNARTLLPIIKEQIDSDTHIMTDEASQYRSSNEWRTYSNIEPHFASHGFVHHGIGEYVRGNVHTNTIEGYFSIFKRGMNGVYQHCSKQHLKRYLCEYDFRYNNRSALDMTDVDRTKKALEGIGGKRLTYRPISEPSS